MNCSGVEVRIWRPDSTGVGEVMARADHLVAPSPDGWLRTDDLGRFDDDGYLYLIGRRPDVIIRGGEKVYPLEVENLLLEHPQIAEAAVVSVPHTERGDLVKAFVVADDPANPPKREELMAFARSVLPGSKVPAQWELVPSLPRSAAGELLRRALVRR
jgi:long-chain acyl-CoA synthetase